MSAVAVTKGLIAVSSRQLSELEALREISRVASGGYDVGAVIESIARLALSVNGVKRLRIDYSEAIGDASAEPFVWGPASNEGAVVCAVASISAGGQTWGELRLYFGLQATALESPLRFAKFLGQQIGLQLNRWALNVRVDESKARIDRLRKIVEKRKALQRARAILANTRQISDAEALLAMRRHSEDSGRSLHQVAEAIIFGDAHKWTSGTRYAERKRPVRLFAAEGRYSNR